MNLLAFIVGLIMTATSITSYSVFRKKMKPKNYKDKPAKGTKLMEITIREFEAILQRITSQIQTTIWQAEFTASIGICGIIAAIAIF